MSASPEDVDAPAPEDMPEYRGKTLTPVSPRPVHVSEPSNIPVLEKQIDPAFNETSAHLEPDKLSPPMASSSENNWDLGATLLEGPSSALFTDGADGGMYLGHDFEPEVNQTDTDANEDYAMSLELDNDDASNPGDATAGVAAGLAADSAAVTSAAAAAAANDPRPLATEGLSLSVTSMEPPPPSHPAIIGAALETLAPALVPEFAAVDVAARVAVAPTEDAWTGHAHPARGESANAIYEEVNIQALLDNLSPPTATAPPASGLTAATNDVSVVTSPAAVESTEATSAPSGLPSQSTPSPNPSRQELAVPSLDAVPQDVTHQVHDVAPGSVAAHAAAAFSPDHATAFVQPQTLAPGVAAPGAPGTTTQPTTGLPPPPLQTVQVHREQGASVPTTPQKAKKSGAAARRRDSAGINDDDAPWPAELEKLYEDFLEGEKVHVADGQWNKFPAQSRLFIGNLPTEKVSKRDLFRVFHKYGPLAQISLKQVYGFVQFLEADVCRRALETEQGKPLRSRKMHLEISKPQRNARNPDQGVGTSKSGGSRRSRSPDHSRGGKAGSPKGQSSNGVRDRDRDRVDRGVDNRSGRRDRAHGERRGRDDYRPGRSPSPRAHRRGDDDNNNHRRGRDRDRSHDRYDGGGRRIRSRSPHRRGDRYRSRTPPSRWAAEEAELMLPKRAPGDVPDLQLVVHDDVDRNFISYLEKIFRERGLRTDATVLNPRIPVGPVIGRHVSEGVLAVSTVARIAQLGVKIPLQIFDRSRGLASVRFEEYDPVDPKVAVELVARAKHVVAAAMAQPPYAAQAFHPAQLGAMFSPPLQHAQQQQQQQQQTAAVPGFSAGTPNFGNLLASLDAQTLQRLLGSMQQPQQQQQLHQTAQQPQVSQRPAAPVSALPADLASLLAGAGAASQLQQPMAYPQRQQVQTPQASLYAALAANPAMLASNPALASMLANSAPAAATNGHHHHHHHHQAQLPGGHQTQPQAYHDPAAATMATSNMQNIMAQLAKWKQ